MEYKDEKITPTNSQRKELYYLTYMAFIEIRLLAYRGKSDQIADLVDATHNLPFMLHEQKLKLSFIELCIGSYQEKYKLKDRPISYDYLRELKKIFKNQT